MPDTKRNNKIKYNLIGATIIGVSVIIHTIIGIKQPTAVAVIGITGIIGITLCIKDYLKKEE